MEKMNIDAKSKETKISDDLVEQVLASIVDTAEAKGVDRHLLVAKVYERSLDNIEAKKAAGEPESKRQKLTNETDPQCSTLLPEKAWGIFLLHGGLEFLPNNALFPSFSLLNSTCQREAKRELAVRCRERHPSLHAAVSSSSNENSDVLLSPSAWQRFELDEYASRTPASALWPAQTSDVIEDIDALLEITKGDHVVWHGVSKLTDDFCVNFQLPHFSFDAPFSEASDVFSGDDTMFPGGRLYYFWRGRDEDCSVEQKTLCKALYGAHSSHLTQRMPPLHVRIVLRRRSNGQMVTVISSSRPNQIMGENYFQPVGSYNVTFHNDEYLSTNRRLLASVEFSLYCSPLKGEGSPDAITFSTREHDELEFGNLKFCFDISDMDGYYDSVNDSVMAAMREWFHQ